MRVAQDTPPEVQKQQQQHPLVLYLVASDRRGSVKLFGKSLGYEREIGIILLNLSSCQINVLIIVSIYQINQQADAEAKNKSEAKAKNTIRLRVNVKSRTGTEKRVIYSSQLISLYHLSLRTNISYYMAIEAVREGSLQSVCIENAFYVVRKPDKYTLPVSINVSEEIIDSSQLVSAKYFARKNDFTYRRVWIAINSDLLPNIRIGNRLYVIERRRNRQLTT